MVTVAVTETVSSIILYRSPKHKTAPANRANALLFSYAILLLTSGC